MFSLQNVIQIVLMFFVLVTLHEWGHYYFAKRAGILVREFAIGFGPKLFSYKKGETRYTLRLLPIGGFVRMAGEDPEIVQVSPGQTVALQLDRSGVVSHLYLDQLDLRSNVVIGEVRQLDLERELHVSLDVDGEAIRYPVHPQALMVTKGRETQIAPLDRQFGSKTVGQRALAIFAGPVMNFLLAFVLFLIAMFMHGIPQQIKLDSVSAGSPAEQAGLKAGDIIKEINDVEIGADSGKIVTEIQKSADRSMRWIIERGGEQRQVQMTPMLKDGALIVGIRMDSINRKATFGEGVTGAWDSMVGTTKNIFLGFKMIVTGNFKLDDLGGPIRIVEVSNEFADLGLKYMIAFSGSLSLYLGIFNLLPIPALDGSRLVFLGYEAVRGRPVDPQRESMVHFIGFALLMLVMLAVTYNDILRLVKG
ncbi:RIP metalloprotease RseP [Paenibacillus cymbidii]|uniref:RIP metalloprotease RseP n=1 Tax=Paenibacillus cymbidii TaxID=1639034 RepID=UPI00108186F4|nr:RIP metalloprotease RseP [Paenibacillus cymbidii]